MKIQMIACVVGAAVVLGGCVGYDTWPPVKGSIARTDPNHPAMEGVMMAGLRWMIERYPPSGHEGQVAVNVPLGIKPLVYQRIAREAGPRAVPFTDATADLPIYHVKAIRVRGRRAELDVLRPVWEMPRSPDGTQVSQGFTLYFEGGLEPWRVVRHREWMIGVMDPPALNPMPAEEPATP